MKTSFVTAYYDLPNKYGGNEKYTEWITNFLKFAKQVNLVVFSTGAALERLQNIAIQNKNLVWIDLPFEQLKMYSYRLQFEQQWTIDPEKDIHTIELYMIWNEKAFFVQRAIELNPHQSTHYCWMDIGMIRDSRLSELIYHFPDEKGLQTLYNLNKMCVLGIGLEHIPLFSDRDECGISILNKKGHDLHTVGGGCIFGPKEQFLVYIQRFFDLFELYIQKHVFAGKDQNIIANLIANHSDEIIVIDPVRTNVWVNIYQPDKWFTIVNVLMGVEPFRVTHTPELMGGFGNQLFQVASVYGIARSRGDLLVLNNRLTHRNPHSRVNYVDTVFKRFLDYSHTYTNVHRERMIHSHDLGLYQQKGITHQLYKGYFQNYKYFDSYLNDFRHLLELPIVPETKAFFIHFRYGDFVNNPNHNMDLKSYYKKCLKMNQEQHGNDTIYYVFTNDQRLAQLYIQQNLGEYLTNNYTIMGSDEVLGLSQMMNCTLGGICSNSTFSWWAGVLNPHPNKKIYFPNLVYPHTSQYRHTNISGMYHPSFTIISV